MDFVRYQKGQKRRQIPWAWRCDRLPPGGRLSSYQRDSPIKVNRSAGRGPVALSVIDPRPVGSLLRFALLFARGSAPSSWPSSVKRTLTPPLSKPPPFFFIKMRFQFISRLGNNGKAPHIHTYIHFFPLLGHSFKIFYIPSSRLNMKKYVFFNKSTNYTPRWVLLYINNPMF